jgi:hypothetical protein
MDPLQETLNDENNNDFIDENDPIQDCHDSHEIIEDIDEDIVEKTHYTDPEEMKAAIKKRISHYRRLQDILDYVKDKTIPSGDRYLVTKNKSNLKRDAIKYVYSDGKLYYQKEEKSKVVEAIRGKCDNIPVSQWVEGQHYTFKTVCDIVIYLLF